MQAIWNGTVLAESDDTVVVEGNHYFPRAALREEYFRDSSTHSTCPWNLDLVTLVDSGRVRRADLR